MALFIASTQQILLFLLSLNLLVSPSLSNNIGCFAQVPPTREQLVPTTFAACYNNVKSLVPHDKFGAAMTFSRKPSAAFRVPHYWKSGNCVLAIDMLSDNDEDIMSFREIAVEAGAVMIRCVAHPPHLGGTTGVGRRRVMNVTVLGYSGQVRGRPLSDLVLPGLGVANATTT